MRPVERGESPQPTDFDDYRDAFPDLMSQLGPYCSYCERRVQANLAVEHIQPKDLYPELSGRWDNFLLGCVNCNSTKGRKDVSPTQVMLPDRDNTLAALQYDEAGMIAVVMDGLTADQQEVASKVLSLTGLDKPISQISDANGQLVAIDRAGQRGNTWKIARRAKELLAAARVAEVLEAVILLAQAEGFFSVWMTVFEDDQDMRRKFIEEFPRTARDCFDPVTTALVSPRPSNGLDGAGKV